MQKYLRRIHIIFITNKLSLHLEALSNGENSPGLQFYSNNDVLTWDTEITINIIKVTML